MTKASIIKWTSDEQKEITVIGLIKFDSPTIGFTTIWTSQRKYVLQNSRIISVTNSKQEFLGKLPQEFGDYQ